ncbi:hypothetical protein POM88_050802 [Heracleum sosnowskyi]|uniref:Uncharacterized protein n=1 Tax=Heracleum sosnowskyi TaxID=360622 RepID=A0AAD8GZE6_9APIA|nr:hypothetical protein POM88_050802 [Heracleum sosnowskyi]
MANHFLQEPKRKEDMTDNIRALSRVRTACEQLRRVPSSTTERSMKCDLVHELTEFYTRIHKPLLDKDLLFSLKASVPKLGEEMTPSTFESCQNLDAGFWRCMDSIESDDEGRYPSLMAVVICPFKLKSVHFVSHSKAAKAIDGVVMTKRGNLGNATCVTDRFLTYALLRMQRRPETFLGNHREVGQFRGKTESTSSANLLGSCLLLRSTCNDHISQKQSGNCEMLVLVCDNLEKENICELSCENSKLVALLLLNETVVDRKLYDKSL